MYFFIFMRVVKACLIEKADINQGVFLFFGSGQNFDAGLAKKTHRGLLERGRDVFAHEFFSVPDDEVNPAGSFRRGVEFWQMPRDETSVVSKDDEPHDVHQFHA